MTSGPPPLGKRLRQISNDDLPISRGHDAFEKSLGQRGRVHEPSNTPPKPFHILRSARRLSRRRSRPSLVT
jgi:hypothetical protein